MEGEDIERRIMGMKKMKILKIQMMMKMRMKIWKEVGNRLDIDREMMMKRLGQEQMRKMIMIRKRINHKVLIV